MVPIGRRPMAAAIRAGLEKRPRVSLSASLDTPVPMSTKTLPAYLSDHMAGSTTALELARRRQRIQGDGEFGRFLATFIRDVEMDQEALRRAMAGAGAPAQPWKTLAAAAASWIDALRPWVGSGPNLVRDLELLILGVRGKELLWEALGSAQTPTLPKAELDRLVARAQEQVRALEALHARAVEAELRTV
jgi:hypothetical protein